MKLRWQWNSVNIQTGACIYKLPAGPVSRIFYTYDSLLRDDPHFLVG